MDEMGPGPRRRLPVPLVALVGLGVAATVAIPAGVMLGSGSSPQASVVTAPSTAAADPSAGSLLSVSPTSAGAPSRALSRPDGLTSAQGALMDRLGMGGVVARSCRGYPPGEQSFDGVVASIECTMTDPAMQEPIVFYQFDSRASTDAYLAQRAADVDVSGDCSSGEEYNGYWGIDGSTMGRLVCVENPKEGLLLFKVVLSLDGTNMAAVVQDDSASAVIAWIREHGPGQFLEN